MPTNTTSPDAKVVVVTGASAGIGQATAARLAQSGWTVIGASRRGTSGPGWTGLVMDVDDDQSVTTGVAKICADHGRLDALVACAGWGLAGPVEYTPVAEARAQLETNFFGAVRTVQAALAPLRQAPSGRIVLMSSIGGVLGIPFQAFYSASKFALEGYGEALAYEVAPLGVHVTLVEPGNVRTDFTAGRHTVSGPDDDNPYASSAQRAITTMERDETDGVGPDHVARTVERVLDARRPPRRCSVGKLDERIGLVGRRLLPYRLYESAAKGSLGV